MPLAGRAFFLEYIASLPIGGEGDLLRLHLGPLLQLPEHIPQPPEVLVRLQGYGPVSDAFEQRREGK